MKTLMIATAVALCLAGIQNKLLWMVGEKAPNAFQASRIQNEKTKIKKEELPEAARKTLEGDAFKGWTLLNAYKLKSSEYEVELKKGDTTQTLKFDKDGKLK